MALPVQRVPGRAPAIIDGGIDPEYDPGPEIEPLDPGVEPGPRQVAPRRQARSYNQLNLYEQLGNVFPDGKTVDLDPPLVLSNLKLNIYGIDTSAKDKRKARQLVDTVPPPLDSEMLEMTYGPGTYMIQAIRSDSGQLITQVTVEVEGEPRGLPAPQPAGGSTQEMAVAVAQAVAAAMAPVLQAIQQPRGQDKYMQLLEKIAVPQLTGEGSGAITRKITENALALQAETFKQQLVLERQKTAVDLRIKEKTIDRQWKKEDDQEEFQRKLALAAIENEADGDSVDEIEEPAVGTGSAAIAEIIKETIGVKSLDIGGGFDLGLILEPVAARLETGLKEKGYHIIAKKDLETIHAAGYQDGLRAGQAQQLRLAGKPRRGIRREPHPGQGGADEAAHDQNDRTSEPAGDTGSVDG